MQRGAFKEARLRKVDPTPYQDVVLTLAGLAAIYSALAVSRFGPYLTGRAKTVARRSIRHLSDDAARVISYIQRLSATVQAKGVSQESLDINHGRMQLNHAEWIELRDIRDNLTASVRNMFKYSDDLIDFFAVEAGPIDVKIKELSAILNEVARSGNYGEAIKLQRTADLLHSYLEDLKQILNREH